MKIVNREEFLKLPSGTLFSKYQPCYFDDITIKGDTWTNDFLIQNIADGIESEGSDDFFVKLTDAEKNGTELKMDFDCYGRDGMFDEERLFAVWSKDDVKALIKKLQESLV
jgi:hypothetical protein